MFANRGNYLGKQCLLLVFAVVALALLWQACLHYVESKTLSSMQRSLGVQLAELDRQLDQLSFIPKILADDSEIRKALSGGQPQAIAAANERLQKTQSESGLEFAFLLNTRGLTVAASNYRDALSFVGVNYSFRPYFTQAVAGHTATYFAVGATTGVPGYFIAEPVLLDDTVLGVVVTKIDLQVLIQAWSESGYFSMLSDEFGVVILSTDSDTLYSPTRVLTDQQRERVNAERRYAVRGAVFFPVSDEPDQWRLDTATQSRDYFVLDRALASEPWTLTTLMPVQSVLQEAAFFAVMVCAGLLILYLLLRVYSQQQRLVLAERTNAQELEKLVQQRTHELASAQQRLISESNFSMLGRMSAAINHEVNQPLASLRFNLASLRKLIAQNEPDEREIEQIVVESDRTTKRIGRVISSLRSVTRREGAQFKRFRLDDTLHEVMATVQRERPVLSTALTMSNELPAVVIMGEEVLIQQALLNLLYNAFDAVTAHMHPVINIGVDLCANDTLPAQRLDQSRHYVCVRVTDNGTGVDSELAESLFEPFSSGRTPVDGLGLGLTISLQIARDHGGELMYTPNTTQQGSCFKLVLPYEHD